jgi:hypothetical protein
LVDLRESAVRNSLERAFETMRAGVEGALEAAFSPPRRRTGDVSEVVAR